MSFANFCTHMATTLSKCCKKWMDLQRTDAWRTLLKKHVVSTSDHHYVHPHNPLKQTLIIVTTKTTPAATATSQGHDNNTMYISELSTHMKRAPSRLTLTQSNVRKILLLSIAIGDALLNSGHYVQQIMSTTVTGSVVPRTYGSYYGTSQ